MDPIANLKEQIELATEIREVHENTDNNTLTLETLELMMATAEKSARLAELVLSLDGWMRSGGFSPWY